MASREELLRTLRALESGRAGYERLQSRTPETIRQLPPDSISIGGLTGSPSFDAYSGTLDALVSAGQLDLIRDVRLQTLLLSWIHGVDDLPENLTSVRAEAERMDHAMEPFGGPFFYSLERFDLSALPRVDAETLAAMRASESVMGAARSYQHHLAFYRGDLERLVPIADSVLALVDESMR